MKSAKDEEETDTDGSGSESISETSVHKKTVGIVLIVSTERCVIKLVK